MVGFQTKSPQGERKRIFRLIPGLERAEFARLGGLHRNTFLNSHGVRPRLTYVPELAIGSTTSSSSVEITSLPPEQRVAKVRAFNVWRGNHRHQRRCIIRSVPS
jgi:Glucose inhibited division protein A